MPQSTLSPDSAFLKQISLQMHIRIRQVINVVYGRLLSLRYCCKLKHKCLYFSFDPLSLAAKYVSLRGSYDSLKEVPADNSVESMLPN